MRSCYLFLAVFLVAGLTVGGGVSCTLSETPPGLTLSSEGEQKEEGKGAAPPDPSITAEEERADILPYDFRPEIMTALTCPGEVQVGSQRFTLMTKGQIYLSDHFKTEHKIQNGTDSQQILEQLNRSPFRKARARLAVQDENNLGSVYQANNADLQAFFPPFDNPGSLDSLSKTGALSDAREGLGGDFSAYLPIPGVDLIHMAPSLADQAPGTPLVTVTYTTDGKAPLFESANKPYGKGYKLHFANPYKADYLSRIREEDFVTGREKDWDCPLKFMVHRASTPAESYFNREMAAYRAHLPEGTLPEGYCHTGRSLNEWERYFFYNIFGTTDANRLPFEVGKTVIYTAFDRPVLLETMPCIKFKRRGCYNAGEYDPSGYYRIEFDPSKLANCIAINQGKNPNQDRYKLCPAFLSICHKGTTGN